MPGITITADSGTQFEVGGAEWNSIARLDDNTFVIAYADSDDFGYGKVVVGTRSGTTITISAGDIKTFHAGTTKYIKVVALSSSTFVISFEDEDVDDPKVIAGTVSGTTITLGSEVTVVATTLAYNLTLAKINSSVFVVAYGDSANLYCYVGSVSGTTITLGDVQTNADADAYVCEATGLSNNIFLAVYYETNYYIMAVAGLVDVDLKTISFGVEQTILSIGSFTNPSSITTIGSGLNAIMTFDDAVNSIDAIGIVVDVDTRAISKGTALAVFASADFSTNVNSTAICDVISTDSNQFAIVGYNTTVSKLQMKAGRVTSDTILTLDAQGAVDVQTSHGIVPYVAICNLGSSAFIIAYKED